MNRQCYEVLGAIEKFEERVKDVPEGLAEKLSAAKSALNDALAGKSEDGGDKPKSFDDAKESTKAKFKADKEKDSEDKPEDE